MALCNSELQASALKDSDSDDETSINLAARSTLAAHARETVPFHADGPITRPPGHDRDIPADG